MLAVNLVEKLELKDEKGILIQGLPSSLEKQFAKLSYAKNVTPLLKSKKVDFVLVFAVNKEQLRLILREVFNALHDKSKLWIASPKATSKISSDLIKETQWRFMNDLGYENVDQFAIDHVWNVTKFSRMSESDEKKHQERIQSEVAEVMADVETEVYKPFSLTDFSLDKPYVKFPVELETGFTKNIKAKEIFINLPSESQQEFVNWIKDAKRHSTRLKRAEETLQQVLEGREKPILK